MHLDGWGSDAMYNSSIWPRVWPTKTKLVMTRVFAAPQPMVFEALSKPELLVQWLSGPPGWDVDDCEVDFRQRGHYRFVWRAKGEPPLVMQGEYRQIVVPERIVSCETFSGHWGSGGAVRTIELAERRGSTKLTSTMVIAEVDRHTAPISRPSGRFGDAFCQRVAGELFSGTTTGKNRG
jgi:uncharacterized protein YndB with AHSA1/START domain